MAQSMEESLLRAIKNDDRKAFDALMEKSQCGAYRLGRFPVLSLLYLYNSKKILSAYEELFLKTTNSVTLGEPAEVSKKFSAKAGKCLRLYMSEVVSPLEMLLILDKTTHLKKVYPMTNLSSAIKERLKSIYYIKYSLGVKFEGGNIVIEKRPMTSGEIKRLAVICVSVVLVFLIVISASAITIVVAPKRLDTYLDVTAYEEYTLDHDVYVPRNLTIEEFNCTIIGNGHKLIFRKGASIDKFYGKLSDLTIESGGNAIISEIAPNASIEDVTINVKASITTDKSTSLIAIINYGTIDGVTLNVSGKVSAIASADNAVDELVVGGLVGENSYRYQVGVINNCKVNFSKFTLVGEASANACFGGVAAINSGYLQKCEVSGKISADTFDVAGVCAINSGGALLSDVNNVDISQTSANEGWSPIASGIVLRNYYLARDCSNTGRISAISTYQGSTAPSATASGIAYLNGGGSAIEDSVNSGDIYASGNGETYVGGICSVAYGYIYNSVNSGLVTAKARSVYAGGILGRGEVAADYYIYYSTVDSCVSQGRIVVEASETAYVGGIVGYEEEMEVEQYVYDEDGYIVKDEDGRYVTQTVYRGGRVINSYFTGEMQSPATYFGNIVGVCGENIYEINSYMSDGKEYYNFDGNYYLSNSFGAFGATVSASGEYNNSVEDKGATSATLGQIEELEAYRMIVSQILYDTPANS